MNYQEGNVCQRHQTIPEFRQFNKFMAGLRDLVQYGKAHFGSQKKCHNGESRCSIPHGIGNDTHGKSKRPHRSCVLRAVLYMVSIAHQKIALIQRSGPKRLDFYTCTASVTLLGDGHS